MGVQALVQDSVICLVIVMGTQAHRPPPSCSAERACGHDKDVR
jgi:hypothetical protein